MRARCEIVTLHFEVVRKDSGIVAGRLEIIVLRCGFARNAPEIVAELSGIVKSAHPVSAPRRSNRATGSWKSITLRVSARST